LALNTRYTIEDLKVLMTRLREPHTGCPWDIQQTFQTIVPSTLEEAYEVAEAIEREDYAHLREELGDLLFQVIFYGQLGSEQQGFSFDDVVSDLTAKLLRRHPHVFPNGTLESRVEPGGSRDTAAIKQQWEITKQAERSTKGQSKILADVPINLPALSRAQKLQKRASSVGFDWDNLNDVVAKAEEELAELKEAIASQEIEPIKEELGDLLFSVVNIARHCKTDAESLLRAGNRKFERRFGYIEACLGAKGESVANTALAELDELWLEAKVQEKSLPL